ncbi:WD repeat-containing protein 6 [Homalodisca vitripennis]|nr:WD repeat-containing protein 6 [Homalodisca vitripennis]
MVRYPKDEWLKDTTKAQLVTLSAHNQLSLWDPYSGSNITTVTCTEQCILYCGSLVMCGDKWTDVVVIAGTVFQQIIVWGVGDNSTSDRQVVHRLSGHREGPPSGGEFGWGVGPAPSCICLSAVWIVSCSHSFVYIAATLPSKRKILIEQINVADVSRKLAFCFEVSRAVAVAIRDVSFNSNGSIK